MWDLGLYIIIAFISCVAIKILITLYYKLVHMRYAYIYIHSTIASTLS